MIKYRIENDISEIDFSIDDTSNALVINTDKNTAIEVPYHNAIKLLAILRQELANSEESNRKRKAGKFKSWLI